MWHILNAQVAIRAPCCRKFFDCAECHNESQDHPIAKTMELAFLCKKCRRAFRKDMARYEQADEFCPHCDNHYVIEAKTPELMLSVEGDDGRVDPRMMRDERMRTQPATELERLQKDAEEGHTIDHGGYQAAALAFQARLASGAAAHKPDDGHQAPSLPPGVDASALFAHNDDDLDWS